ncbi:DUF1294 domain-containing protein [Qipengyuania polymorpha]
MTEYLIYYLIAVNFIAFAAFGIDKSLAESGGRRIREDTLIFLAFIGGLPGAYAGRAAFRHKTRKKSFSDRLFVTGVLQLCGAVAIGAMLFSGQSLPGMTLFETEEEKAARLAVEASVHYAGCNQVRAAGKAPLYRGQPGYREGMDGDGDGVACEPHY